MIDRLVRNWVYGGFLAGLLILALSPVLFEGWTAAMIAVFLQLPVYMVHQYEEHEDGRFGRFVNGMLGDGRTVLSDRAIFVVNVPGVWGVDLVSIGLAHFAGIGFGLLGIYLTLVNALAHLGPAIALRRYNPGLVTAILLFLPLAIWALAEVQATGEARLWHHLLGLGSALLIHGAILAWATRFRRRAGVR